MKAGKAVLEAMLKARKAMPNVTLMGWGQSERQKGKPEGNIDRRMQKIIATGKFIGSFEGRRGNVEGKSRTQRQCPGALL